MSLRIPAPILQAAYLLLTCLRSRSALQYSDAPFFTLFKGSNHLVKKSEQASQRIPSRIWTYWDSETPDALVDQCIANWQTHNPGFEVHVLNSQNIDAHIPLADLPADFAALHPTKRSDWIRLYVVGHYGGYWLDASILLTRSLEWLETLRHAQHAEFVGFYLEGYSRDAGFPVVESWAFGAPANSPFVLAWQKEFHLALIATGTDAYLDALRKQHDGPQILQGIADPAYLLIHVAAQQVLRRRNDFHLALFKAEDTAYFYQKVLWWKWYLLYPRLCLMQSEPCPAPLIKLRGGERRHFAELFALQGGPAQGSIWQRACYNTLSGDKFSGKTESDVSVNGLTER